MVVCSRLIGSRCRWTSKPSVSVDPGTCNTLSADPAGASTASDAEALSRKLDTRSIGALTWMLRNVVNASPTSVGMGNRAGSSLKLAHTNPYRSQQPYALARITLAG